tara:strand:- start:205 stop:621 length:417 start_codon:yes stop_codon:yes gene_type:complete
MPIDSQHFLEIYAKALNTFDPKKVASFCLPPTIVMNDKNKKVIASEAEIEQAVSRMFAKFNQAGIKTFVPKLQQTMRLSDTLFFSKMRWQFYDTHEQLCFGCATSYTLQIMPDKQLKIIVAVIDDDENKLADIFALAE